MQAILHRHCANVRGMDAGKATQALGQSEGYGCRQYHTDIVPIWGVWMQAMGQSGGYGCRRGYTGFGPM